MIDYAMKVFDTYDYKKTDEYKRHEQAMQKVKEMSLAEKLQTLIDAGILNEEGKLIQCCGDNADG